MLPTDPPMFAVYIEGKLPSLDSFLGPGWTQGPASPMAMSHREFLNMVTPKMAQPYGSFGPKELAVLLPQALATGLLVNYLPNAIKGFVSDRRAAAARREVQEVLAELERRRRRPKPAPLPPTRRADAHPHLHRSPAPTHPPAV